MKKLLSICFALLCIGSYCVGSAMAVSTEEIAKASALEEILKRGVLWVGLEAGYQPFEMQDEKGNIVGFDVDMAYEMGKALFGEGGEKKVKLINTAWEGIIPALMTHKFDIIMSGMTILQSRNLKVNFCEPYYYIGQCLLIQRKDRDKYFTPVETAEGTAWVPKYPDTPERIAREMERQLEAESKTKEPEKEESEEVKNLREENERLKEELAEKETL